MLFFFFKQKTAYEMRISDWSSDVCSSDLSRADDRARRDRAASSGTSADGYWRQSFSVAFRPRSTIFPARRNACEPARSCVARAACGAGNSRGAALGRGVRERKREGWGERGRVRVDVGGGGSTRK